jgi:hypothetical protein
MPSRALPQGEEEEEGVMRAGRCPKCHGNLYFEADVAEGLLLRKCLQCGLIESYFWLERASQRLIPQPVEHEQPVTADMW